MSDGLKFEIDIEALASQFKEEAEKVQEALYEGVKALSAMTYARVVELANEKLHSTRQDYINALDYKEISKGVWIVSLSEKMLWLEEGKDPGSMIDDLLKKNPKIAKDGTKYKVVPFEHSKAPDRMSKHHQSLVNDLRKELKSRNIPFKKIEKNPDGSPRIGKLHTLNIPSPLPTPRASYETFHGLTIYQHRTPSGSIRRDIMTFRVASEKHKQQGKWYYPGLEAYKLMDKAFEASVQEFETSILPSILAKYEKS
jgi:hypothetical protein